MCVWWLAARREHYVTQVRWSDDDRLAVVWSNRAQNASITTICDITADSCYSVSIVYNIACIHLSKLLYTYSLLNVTAYRSTGKAAAWPSRKKYSGCLH